MSQLRPAISSSSSVNPGQAHFLSCPVDTALKATVICRHNWKIRLIEELPHDLRLQNELAKAPARVGLMANEMHNGSKLPKADAYHIKA